MSRASGPFGIGDGNPSTAPRGGRAVLPSVPAWVWPLSFAVAIAWYATMVLWFFGPALPAFRFNDLLFGTDVQSRLTILTNPGLQFTAIVRIESVVHPALFNIWRPVALAMSAFIPPVWAATILVLFVYSVGTTCVAAMAVGYGGVRRGLFIFAMYLFASSSVVAIVPEHWGLSGGLLPALFLLFLKTIEQRSFPRLLGLVVVSILAAGTTITNGILAAFLLLWVVFLQGRWKPFLAVLLAGALFAARYASFALKATRISEQVTSNVNPDALRGLAPAMTAAIAFLTYPVGGAAPLVRMLEGHPSLTFMPIDLSAIGALRLPGTIAWIAILCACTAGSIRTPRTRPFACILVGWILFNLVLHTFWGDELFVYSVHWTWSMIGLVAIGCSRFRSERFAFACGLVIATELVSLWQLGATLRSLPL